MERVEFAAVLEQHPEQDLESLRASDRHHDPDLPALGRSPLSRAGGCALRPRAGRNAPRSRPRTCALRLFCRRTPSC
jgi:hypothetical protein